MAWLCGLVQSKRQSATGSLVAAISLADKDRALPLSPPIEAMISYKRPILSTTAFAPVLPIQVKV